MANVGGEVGSINQFGNEVLPGVQTPRETPVAPPEMIAADEAKSAARNAPPPRDADGNTIIDALRATAPLTKDKSDYELSRIMYDAGGTKAAPVADGETYAQYAARVGVQQSPLRTFANEGLAAGTMHLTDPVQSAFSGLQSLYGGDGFMSGYRQKGQELADQHAVGAQENPWSAVGGTAAGTIAPYAKFAPAIRDAVTGIQGLKPLADYAKTSPLADAITKFGALTGADRGSQSIQEQILRTDDSSLGSKALSVLGDTAGGAIEGAGSAALGGGISKGLSAFAGPLLSSLGEGMTAADAYMKGVPRSLYTRIANRLSDGFVGAADSPSVAAGKIDANFYGSALDKGTLDVPKALTQLSDMIRSTPGTATVILESALRNAPEALRPALQRALNGIETGAPGALDEAARTLQITNQLAGDSMQRGAMSGLIESHGVNAAPPGGEVLPPGQNNVAAAWRAAGDSMSHPVDNAAGGQSDFLGNIYKDLIGARLHGPIDASSAFDRNAITGALTDKGKLIQPPLSGMSALGQALYERLGGGPGRVVGGVGGMIDSPLESLGGLMSRIYQPASMFTGKVAGPGLELAGKAIGKAGAPGTALADQFPSTSSAIASMPGAYQNAINSYADHNTIGDMANSVGSAASAVGSTIGRGLDYINPFHKAAPPPPAPENHSEWISDPSVSTADKVAFVGSRVPQIAGQLNTGSPEGDGAALTLALLNPAYRSQLS